MLSWFARKNRLALGIEIHRCFASRIATATQERATPSHALHQRLATLGAEMLCLHGLRPGGFSFPRLDVLALRIARAAEELAGLAESNHQWFLTERTFLIRLHTTHRRHLGFGYRQGLLEGLPELREHLIAASLAVFNQVQFALHVTCELQVHNFRKMLYQEIRYDHADFRGVKPTILLLHVIAFLNLADNRGISAGSSNAFLFQSLDQRRFIKSW